MGFNYNGKLRPQDCCCAHGSVERIRRAETLQDYSPRCNFPRGSGSHDPATPAPPPKRHCRRAGCDPAVYQPGHAGSRGAAAAGLHRGRAAGQRPDHPGAGHQRRGRFAGGRAAGPTGRARRCAPRTRDGRYRFIAVRLPYGTQHDEDAARAALAFIRADEECTRAHCKRGAGPGRAACPSCPPCPPRRRDCCAGQRQGAHAHGGASTPWPTPQAGW